MAKATAGIGSKMWIAPSKSRRRSKAKHLRGLKSLGPKSGMRGDRGKY